MKKLLALVAVSVAVAAGAAAIQRDAFRELFPARTVENVHIVGQAVQVNGSGAGQIVFSILGGSDDPAHSTVIQIQQSKTGAVIGGVSDWKDVPAMRVEIKGTEKGRTSFWGFEDRQIEKYVRAVVTSTNGQDVVFCGLVPPKR